MLRREHDGRDLARLALLVAHGHLALGVRPEPARIAVLVVTGLRESLQDLVAVVDRRGHEFRRLVAGEAEHDPLIARALGALLVGRVVHTLRDVRRLAVQQYVDLAGLVVKAVLLVADVTDRAARHRAEAARLDGAVLLEERIGRAKLAGDDHSVGGAKHLARNTDLPWVHAGLLGLAVDEVDDLVGDAVRDLVWMAFGNGLGREKVVLAHGRKPRLAVAGPHTGGPTRDAASRAANTSGGAHAPRARARQDSSSA